MDHLNARLAVGVGDAGQDGSALGRQNVDSYVQSFQWRRARQLCRETRERLSVFVVNLNLKGVIQSLAR